LPGIAADRSMFAAKDGIDHFSTVGENEVGHVFVVRKKGICNWNANREALCLVILFSAIDKLTARERLET
jgi:hypothetical protein